MGTVKLVCADQTEYLNHGNGSVVCYISKLKITFKFLQHQPEKNHSNRDGWR